MKNAVVFYNPDLAVEIQDIPTPPYTSTDILIRVHAAGSNPKDWKHPMPYYYNNKVNQGDDAAGTVAGVGSGVVSGRFREGDRVAGFHEMDTDSGGAYAEYAVCPANTVFHIPEGVSFEEAATVPLAAYTAAIGLFRNLGVPMPFERVDAGAARAGGRVPLIVNAASSAVGAFAVKLARLTGGEAIGPIIGVAGASAAFAREVGCDVVVDYRSEDVLGQLRKALSGGDAGASEEEKVYVFDANNSAASMKYLLPLLNGGKTGSRLTYTSKPADAAEQDELRAEAGVVGDRIWVGGIHGTEQPGVADPPKEWTAGAKMFGSVMSTVFEEAMQAGRLKGHPHTVVAGGLNGLLGALIELRDRKGGNTKFVTRIADTEGVSLL